MTTLGWNLATFDSNKQIEELPARTMRAHMHGRFGERCTGPPQPAVVSAQRGNPCQQRAIWGARKQ